MSFKDYIKESASDDRKLKDYIENKIPKAWSNFLNVKDTFDIIWKNASDNEKQLLGLNPKSDAESIFDSLG